MRDSKRNSVSLRYVIPSDERKVINRRDFVIDTFNKPILRFVFALLFPSNPERRNTSSLKVHHLLISHTSKLSRLGSLGFVDYFALVLFNKFTTSGALNDDGFTPGRDVKFITLLVHDSRKSDDARFANGEEEDVF